jgi:lipoate-protein ligase A
MAIQELITSGSSNTILMLTPAMLQEFAATLISEASERLKKEEERTYTPAEFAERHRVDKSTLWRWNRDGLLKKTIIGGKVFYRDSDLTKKEG